jgi:aspartyl-tRNA synthetase
MLRTHNCGELKKSDVGKKVTLCGWIATRRDHGDLIFIDLRDKHGVTQIVFDPARNKDAHGTAHKLRNEYCIKGTGKVIPRPEGTVNKGLGTGEIEVEIEALEILSESETPPFEVKDSDSVNEEVRLRYRYLDLRRQSMQNNLTARHNTYKYIFDFMSKEDFVYVDTPILTKSTPEGARDFLVPSRMQEGAFYALPQSPQIFKQLLMVAGTERYFQIAKCFRDEDLRADRQPEFTQLDIEMSFIDQEDLFDICERLFKGLFKEIIGVDIRTPFERMPYAEAMSKYGSDKPDVRFDLFLSDMTGDVKGCDFKIFNDVVSSGGAIVALAAPGYKDMSRKEIDDLTLYLKDFGAKGLAYFKVEENDLVSPIVKFFPKEMLELFRKKTGAKPGDMIFMVADVKETARAAMGALRLKIGKEKGLCDPKVFKLLWIVDFPLFKFNREENRWESEHHPFTYFDPADMKYMDSGELDKIRSRSYDLVLNGTELGSGSIRIHRRDIQQRIFDALGISREESQKKFGFLLDAFQYGPPPHGGVAFGIDRLLTLFTGDTSIREVIAFPKNQRGICPLSQAPSNVDEKQLRELGIRVNKK